MLIGTSWGCIWHTKYTTANKTASIDAGEAPGVHVFCALAFTIQSSIRHWSLELSSLLVHVLVMMDGDISLIDMLYHTESMIKVGSQYDTGAANVMNVTGNFFSLVKFYS